MCSDNEVGVFIGYGTGLAATFTASAFVLVGPYACYEGVCIQAESVHPKTVF